MLKKLTGTLLLGAVLVFGAAVVNAQTVDLFMSTSTGTDTLYVGVPASLYFHANAAAATAGANPDLAAITWPMVVTFTNGNIIGPLNDFNVGAPGIFTEPGASVFENNAWNAIHGTAATDPDFMLWANLDFGGTSYTSDGTVDRIDFTPLDTGCFTIDSGTVDGQQISAVDVGAVNMPFTWTAKTICVIVLPNQPPVCNGVNGVPGPTTFGSLISGVCVDASDPDGLPGPLSYFIASAVNSNATGPNNPMSVDGSGCFSWQTSNANGDDAGVWTIQIGVTDGVDTAYCEFQLTIITQTPFCFHIDTLSTLVGSTVEICVTMQKDAGLEVAGGFDLLMTKPQSDDRSIDAGLQEIDGSTVAQYVRRYPFSLERGAFPGRHSRVFGDQTFDGIATEGASPQAREECVVCSGTASAQPELEYVHCRFAQGCASLFAALAAAAHIGTVSEFHVGAAQAGQFRNT